MTLRRYAEGTRVSADRSQAEVKRLLGKHGAQRLIIDDNVGENHAVIIWCLHDRVVRQTIQYPATEHPRRDAEIRRVWRVFLIGLKYRLEVIQSGDSTMDREFMADILLPDNRTVGELAFPEIEAAYLGGAPPVKLLGQGDADGENARDRRSG